MRRDKNRSEGIASVHVSIYVCMYVWVIAEAMGAIVAPKSGLELRAAVAEGICAHWVQRSALKGKLFFDPLCRLRGGSSPNDDYSKMKLSDLQKELRGRGLSTKGLKNELIQRLQQHLAEASGHAPSTPASAKRDARELAHAGIHDDDQSRQKQAAVADSDHQEELCEGENVPAPVPVPMAAPPRVHVDSSGEGVVKVYNSYSIKDKCRAAGFQFDATERAWIKSAAAVLEQLGVASFEDMTPDNILEMIQNTDEIAVAMATPTKEPEACRAEVQDGMVRISGGTYPIKDKLRAAGFKWDGDLSAWTRSEAQVSLWINELHVKQGKEAVDASSNAYADAVMTAVTELDETSQTKPAVDPIKPVLSIKEDKVCVYNSYDIKDQLRALGFRFNSADKAWVRALDEVLALSSEFERGDDVSLDKLLALDAPPLVPQEDAPEKAAPSLRVIDAEVQVYNSYAIKEQLRALGFRWSVKKSCWTHNLQSVMEAVGVGVAEDLTVEMCTAVGEQLRASGDSAAAAAAAGRQKPEMRVVGDEVQVLKSYDVKEKLRALGFTWNTESVCWRIDAMQLLQRMEVHELAAVTIEDILALEPAAESAEKEKDPPRLAFSDGDALVYNSYDIKDKLRAVGFRWDSSRSVWVKPADQLLAAAGVEDEAQLSLEKVLALAPASGSDVKRPYLTCDEDEVRVFNSYEIKDTMRALSFRWDSSRAAWARATPEVLQMLGAERTDDITMEALLKCPPPAQQEEDGTNLGGGGASLEMLNDEVLIYNSYAIKDKLRALDFRFDSERRVWVRSVFEVKRLLGLEDHSDITLDRILTLCETLPQPDAKEDRSEREKEGAANMQTQRVRSPSPPLRAGGLGAHVRSPSPAMLDQTPGEHLLSSMGHSLQGWSKSAHEATAS